MEEKLHNLVLEDRKRLSVTSCSEVISFNENEVSIVCNDSTLTVKGANLKVEEVSKSSGDVVITGDSIDSVTYSKSVQRDKGGFFGRMFK